MGHDEIRYTFWTCSGHVPQKFGGSKMKFSPKVSGTFGLCFGIIPGVKNHITSSDFLILTKIGQNLIIPIRIDAEFNFLSESDQILMYFARIHIYIYINETG